MTDETTGKRVETGGTWNGGSDPEGRSSSMVMDDAPAPTVAERPSIPPRPPVTRETVGSAGPPSQGIAAALFYALCTISLGYPAIAGKFLAGPNSDQFVAGYAFREFGASVLRATGGFAQWNPYLFGGMPYIAAMHGDIFYPTFLLRMVMPTDVAMTWSFILPSCPGDTSEASWPLIMYAAPPSSAG